MEASGMVRRVRVAMAVLAAVLLLSAAACGDDDGGNDAVASGAGDRSSTTAPGRDEGDAAGGGTGLKPAPQAGEPDITGPITEVLPAGGDTKCEQDDEGGTADPDQPVSDDMPVGCTTSPDLWATIVVRDGVDPKGGALAASISVPTDVPVLLEDGAGGWLLGSFDDLTEGTSVQVWFTGPVAESYPVQATASSIVVEA
jgi:hypothetical protein